MDFPLVFTMPVEGFDGLDLDGCLKLDLEGKEKWTFV